ncbi:hypothetical protein L292_1759 [Acinetobacter junii CIP 107470 = MTCC 11364]|uniref:TraL protein n=1 Tax=Acinetobacter junii CIP 107470 = MTCC 11364 TaxID=1217666 RepID=S7XM45_ACIJU|nr:hypothetical protein [Acinetobacter junii]ENV52061.1 hypothetical protein F953_00473 [Acinetobacter junii CIP 107470 = MTCC 11364]EPR80174.1 hypothetical protein L292_1759 [Acinetobacter junii CIP 107470 = MTCC 11364]
MKKQLAVSLLLTTFTVTTPIVTTSAYASTVACRSGEAASRGAKTAYEEEIEKAEKNAQKEKNTSDSAAQCLSGISAVITGGTFPTWDSVYKAIRQKVCSYVNEQINTAVGKINQKISQVYKKVNDEIDGAVGGGIAGDIIGDVGVGGGGLQTNSNGSGNVVNTNDASNKASDIWANIWK